jgi:hypothetical protein
LLRGEADESSLITAASIVARYCKGKSEPKLTVEYLLSNNTEQIITAPAEDNYVSIVRI